MHNWVTKFFFPSTAAAFLRNFVTMPEYAHLDIAGMRTGWFAPDGCVRLSTLLNSDDMRAPMRLFPTEGGAMASSGACAGVAPFINTIYARCCGCSHVNLGCPTASMRTSADLCALRSRTLNAY